MMKFTDIIKACVRYWFIIVICIALCCPIAIGITFNKNSYSAKATILVDKSDKLETGETLSSAYIDSVIKEANMIVEHHDFLMTTLEELGKSNPEYAENCSVNSIRNNLSFEYKKGDNFFGINYEDKNSENAKEVVSIITNQLIKEFDNKIDSRVKFVQVYSIELDPNMSNTAVYAVIGILIGLVLGIVIITFMVVFNPYIENEELLVSQTNVDILASFDKEKEAK